MLFLKPGRPELPNAPSALSTPCSPKFCSFSVRRTATTAGRIGARLEYEVVKTPSGSGGVLLPALKKSSKRTRCLLALLKNYRQTQRYQSIDFQEPGVTEFY